MRRCASLRGNVWIRRDTVLAIHEAQIAEHGGLLGLRDAGLLDSALARPRIVGASAEFQRNVPALGARYAIAVIRSHPFIDGNKRVGLVLLELFLNLNGYDLETTDEESFGAIIALAAGKISDDEFIAWVRERVSRRPAQSRGLPRLLR